MKNLLQVDLVIKQLEYGRKQEELTLYWYSEHASSVSFSPDEKFFASGSGDKSVKISYIYEKKKNSF